MGRRVRTTKALGTVPGRQEEEAGSQESLFITSWQPGGLKSADTTRRGPFDLRLEAEDGGTSATKALRQAPEARAQCTCSQRR
eukprot:15426597-Heterocapsa_arctica.AAC.1